jgi:hypothetical protein
MNRWLWRSLLVVVALSLGSFSALAQRDKTRGMNCENSWSSERLANHCEIKEQTLAPAGLISVDARKNGGVSVKGWERNEVLVRSKVQAAAPTQAEADELAKQVNINTAGGKIFADGPENRKDYWWSVSYELFVPRRSDLSLESNNGGIAIADVSGRLEFTALNAEMCTARRLMAGSWLSLKVIGGTVRRSTSGQPTVGSSCQYLRITRRISKQAL